MKGVQLDLFSPVRCMAAGRPPAEVHILPNWIRQEAREAATRILRRPPDKQAWHRRNEASTFWGKLFTRGIRDETLAREARIFGETLDAEPRRQRVIAFLWGKRGDVA